MAMPGLHEEPISQELRGKRRKGIGLAVAVGLAVCAAAWALTDWPDRKALGAASLVVVFGALLWWGFASRKAGRLSGRLLRGPRPQGLLTEKYWDNWKG